MGESGCELLDTEDTEEESPAEETVVENLSLVVVSSRLRLDRETATTLQNLCDSVRCLRACVLAPTSGQGSLGHRMALLRC